VSNQGKSEKVSLFLRQRSILRKIKRLNLGEAEVRGQREGSPTTVASIGRPKMGRQIAMFNAPWENHLLSFHLQPIPLIKGFHVNISSSDGCLVTFFFLVTGENLITFSPKAIPQICVGYILSGIISKLLSINQRNYVLVILSIPTIYLYKLVLHIHWFLRTPERCILLS